MTHKPLYWLAVFLIGLSVSIMLAGVGYAIADIPKSSSTLPSKVPIANAPYHSSYIISASRLPSMEEGDIFMIQYSWDGAIQNAVFNNAQEMYDFMGYLGKISELCGHVDAVEEAGELPAR